MKNLKFFVSITIFSISFSVFADKTLIVKNYFCPDPQNFIEQAKMGATKFSDSMLQLTFQISCNTNTISTLIWKEVRIDNSKVDCIYQFENKLDICTLTATGRAKPTFPFLWTFDGKCGIESKAGENRQICVFTGEFIRG